MPIIQLPLAQPIDLSSRATFLWWNQEPRRQTRMERAEFWRGMTGLTLPQEMALRLGRTPDLVSIQLTSGSYHRRASRLHEPTWACYELLHYPTIWRRTHTAIVFRIARGRGVGRMHADNPLRKILAWAEPEDLIEDRFLMAGYDQGWGYRRRRDHVRQALRNARRDGYIADVDEARVRPHVWVPHPAWCREIGIRDPRIRDVALDHGALAVEAALMRQGLRDTTAAVRALRSEADLASEMRRSQGRAVSAGDRFDALPDLELVTRAGQRYCVEVLSETYTNGDLAAKYRAIERAVEYVATSPTVARRVLRVNPGTTCFHF